MLSILTLEDICGRNSLDHDAAENGGAADLRAALDAALAGKPVASRQKPSIGCNIKWKPGNEPDYYFKRS